MEMKRFRDTGIWDKSWFRKLGAAQKCAWTYLTDRCDNVGVIALDKELVEFCIGSKVDWEGLLAGCNGNIEVLENGKLWLVDFCLFQHGDLFSRAESSVTKSYHALLSKHGLTQRVGQVFANSCQTVQGIGIGKGKGKGEGKGKGKSDLSRPPLPDVEPDFEQKEWVVSNPDDMVAWQEHWEKVYPTIDVKVEARNALEYVIAHPEKHYTKWFAYLSNWMRTASRYKERENAKSV